MPDEVTRNDSEESVHDCSGSAWVGRTGGWYCCHCGQWQCFITGRASIRDPEPFHDLKPLAKRHAERVVVALDPALDAIVTYTYSEIDYALFEAFTNDWEPDADPVQHDDRRDSEVRD